MALPSRYSWNERAGRYRDANGRFVSRAIIRREIDATILRSQQRMLSVAEQLRQGAISLDDWFIETRRIIKEVHLYNAAAAKGGWAQLENADYMRIGKVVLDQFTFLKNFGTQIADGLTLDGSFVRRITLYAQAGRSTYHAIELEEMKADEMTEERSVLHPADHCGDCIEEAGKGWQPIGTLTPIGERQCLGGCKCSMEYR